MIAHTDHPSAALHLLSLRRNGALENRTSETALFRSTFFSQKQRVEEGAKHGVNTCGDGAYRSPIGRSSSSFFAPQSRLQKTNPRGRGFSATFFLAKRTRCRTRRTRRKHMQQRRIQITHRPFFIFFLCAAIAPSKNDLLKKRFFGQLFARENNALQKAPNTT